MTAMLAAAAAAVAPAKERAEGKQTAVSASAPYMRITVIDYGPGNTVRGDATLLESDGKALLIDTGDIDPNNTVVGFLKKNGIKDLSLYISHYHSDHCAYAARIINDSWFHVHRVYLANPEPFKRYVTPYEKSHHRALYESCRECGVRYKGILSAARKKGISVRNLRKGDTFSVGSAKARVLWDRNPRGVGAFDPYDKSATGYLNNSSLVTKFTLGKRSFLTGGDIEASTERDLLAAGTDLSADIFKLNHHGIWSANTAAFLKAVDPCYVYYAYKNRADQEYRRFGSAADVASNLKKLAKQYNILGNRYNGTITYTIQYNTIHVSAQRHVRKKTIQVRNRSDGTVRAQTLVYNDAQQLYMDDRMFLSGTSPLTYANMITGIRRKGWTRDSRGWRYRTRDGRWMSGGWKVIGGKTYYFTVKGYRHEGWLTLGGRKYFMSRTGVRQYGWQMIDGKVYYFKKDGSMASGKTWIGGSTWPLRQDGSLDLSRKDAPGINILTVERRHTTKK